jgi:hypothetical protein
MSPLLKTLVYQFCARFKSFPFESYGKGVFLGKTSLIQQYLHQITAISDKPKGVETSILVYTI